MKLFARSALLFNSSFGTFGELVWGEWSVRFGCLVCYCVEISEMGHCGNKKRTLSEMCRADSPSKTLKELHNNVFNLLIRRKRRKLYNNESGLEIIWYRTHSFTW